MDTLLQIYTNPMNNNYLYNHHSAATFTADDGGSYRTQCPSNEPSPVSYQDRSPTTMLERDHYDSVLKFVTDMLMEEDDLQDKPCMLNECLALQVQAAEMSLYDVLINKQPTSTPFDVYQNGCGSPPDCSVETISSESSNNSSTAFTTGSNSGYYHTGTVAEFLDGINLNGRKRSPAREEGGKSKQLATVSELESDQLEFYDEYFLLCDNEPKQAGSISSGRKINGSKRGRPRGKKNTTTIETVVDLRNLLTLCSQAITHNNFSSAYELLRKIKQHSSPYGDSTERLAHYFANAIDARLAGTGAEIYGAYKLRKISAAQILRAYHSYMMASPFHRMSNILANGSIRKLAEGKRKLHIIDFGILYGFQWPCFIKRLSLRPGGPPKLRITGIDLPQPGFRPAERVDDTGRRLAKYCKRFHVPFEYVGIAKKWEEIKIEDLRIERDELTVVNCMYRLRHIHDETVVESSPRDMVLGLIRQIKPDLFVHGVLNGTHNAPFLLSRFREALFFYSTLFDIFDVTAEKEDKHRLLFEQEVFGRDVMNVIACEGTSRIERPETYKQWQSRSIRAGFRQVPLYREKVQEVKEKVRLNYHKDFLVDEDSNWMLQGWKGRVLYAVSMWKPA